LFDTKTKKIVTNESAEICAIFDSAFDEFAANPQWSMYPAGVDATTVQAAMDADFRNIASKGYALMFAKNQVDHYCAIKALQTGLDGLESV
jgi:glutathionyl-hydroquinone reductase